MKKFWICLILLLTGCSIQPAKEAFVMDDTSLSTQFVSYQNASPTEIRVILVENAGIYMHPVNIFDADEKQIETIMETIQNIETTYYIQRNESMVTRVILQLKDVNENVWVMEELWDGKRTYISVNEFDQVLASDISLVEVLSSLQPEESTLKWQIRNLNTLNYYGESVDVLDENLAMYVEDELTQKELMLDERMYVDNFHYYPMSWNEYRNDLLNNRLIDESQREFPFMDVIYGNGRKLIYHEDTDMLEVSGTAMLSMEKKIIQIASSSDESNNTTKYFLRYEDADISSFESYWEWCSNLNGKDLYNVLTWVMYHPKDFDLIQVENKIIDGNSERTATLLQSQSDLKDKRANSADFILEEKGYIWHNLNKQAYLFENLTENYYPNSKEPKLSVMHENHDFISLSYEPITGRNYLISKQDGLTYSDEMVLEKYFEKDAHLVIEKAEQQLGMNVCEFSDYESNKDVEKCFEVEWTREILDDKEDRLLWSAFRVNEEGKLLLDVFVKEYGFRDHVESVIFE